MLMSMHLRMWGASLTLATVLAAVDDDQATCSAGDGGCSPAGRSGMSFEVVHEWAQLDYQWESPAAREEALRTGAFQPEHNTLTGLKLCNREVASNCEEDMMFGTVPRWAPGVPGTLNLIVRDDDGNSVLRPWPSREAQDPGDCSKIQYVQSMEIDPDGVMWIVDVGRKYFAKPPASGPDDTCPPKIVLIDIASQRIIQTDWPSHEVAPHDSSFLNDIVLDVPRQIAYMSDTGGENAAIVVYDRVNRRFRRFEDESTRPMPGNVGAKIDIQGFSYPQLTGFGTDGIALAPKRDKLYYCHLGGFNLYSVDTEILRDFAAEVASISAKVVNHGPMPSNPDGMSFGSDGSLFFGGMTTDALYRWSVADGTSVSDALVVARSAQHLWWVDTFAWDNRGSLFATTNRLNAWFFPPVPMNFTGEDSNFRVVKIPVGTKSYMCSQDGVLC